MTEREIERERGGSHRQAHDNEPLPVYRRPRRVITNCCGNGSDKPHRYCVVLVAPRRARELDESTVSVNTALSHSAPGPNLHT